jgi:cobalt-zinc-cadmium efflux system outer membrane protein
VPDVTLQTTYNSSRSITDLPVPLAAIPDLSRTLSFGVSVTLPFFNRNQGNRAEAEIILKQARQHREQVEKLARYEIVTALARFRAAHNAFRTLNEGAVTRSMHNLHAMQAAYSLGAYRMTELIAEQRRWLDVQRELTEALAEQNRALIVFHQASGFVSLTK